MTTTMMMMMIIIIIKVQHTKARLEESYKKNGIAQS